MADLFRGMTLWGLVEEERVERLGQQSSGETPITGPDDLWEAVP